MNRKFIRGIRRKHPWDIAENEVTPEAVFRDRRRITAMLGLGALSASLPGYVQAGIFDLFGEDQPLFATRALNFTVNSHYQTAEQQTPYDKVIRHNNFYEFGTGKQDPFENAQKLKVNPWQLNIEGLVDKPLTLDYDDLYKLIPLEQRIYRLRCVEAWSMVIPWVGFPLAALLKKVGVSSKASHVAFETLFDPEQMPGQRNPLMGGGIHYPYVEGLRLDEAMNELTFLAVGLYDQTLSPQSGAPIRLVVPWKYGFKSIKSVVRIRLVDKEPPNSWHQLVPHEYGFYANVNPEVDHPRWSQASERRIAAGGLFNAKRIATLPFNGYGEQVAAMYQGMDLRKYF
ncbi:protein-methionine-sulfoxide reductase catalytic subunit MsrP [Shewanella yunxiaonensis]|uniref:Protein-methionine-sulfoxide reductase catalytic subunit MsrP n=1 Tax=Shewanella yunxiaonensis TaxID=2829809 RepID=A0ABX7YXJ0_9GAMM|nr:MULTISPECIES: protein-methionine-sulfoxide reductase catalytic subunit MsrP [Shewanella]MDF0534420.1 protein-methionine-sulfoxide reductase catalytic subunit MsrP [Shewanella sp. A32]QUN07390.1 protein-methionine-sulfoxide reductase catalytic subunit MsrP [Shewanella yunxiaonensis]